MDFLPPHLRVPAAVASYSVCSGTMLLFNKLAMYYGMSRVRGKYGEKKAETEDRVTDSWVIKGYQDARGRL